MRAVMFGESDVGWYEAEDESEEVFFGRFDFSGERVEDLPKLYRHWCRQGRPLDFWLPVRVVQ